MRRKFKISAVRALFISITRICTLVIIFFASGIGGIVPVVRKALCIRIESIYQPALGCSNPDHPHPVFIDCPYRIIAQAVRVVQIVLVADESDLFRVILIEAAAPGTNP